MEIYLKILEAVVRRCFSKQVFLKISQITVLESLLNHVETPSQVFSCETCETSKNTFFKEPFRRLHLCLKNIFGKFNIIQKYNLLVQQEQNLEVSPEVFYKKSFLKKMLQYSQKASVMESLFNKVTVFRPATLLKRDSIQWFFSKKF